MKKHLCFTGFMGSGKSTIAQKIATHSSLPFVDLDEYIQEKEKKTILEIFQEGEEVFREKERYYLKEVLETPVSSVIALGGGTICFYDNLNKVLQHGWLVAILPPIDVLLERLWNERYKRPLIAHIQTKTELQEFIEKKLSERMPFYLKADWVIEQVL